MPNSNTVNKARQDYVFSFNFPHFLPWTSRIHRCSDDFNFKKMFVPGSKPWTTVVLTVVKTVKKAGQVSQVKNGLRVQNSRFWYRWRKIEKDGGKFFEFLEPRAMFQLPVSGYIL